MTLWTVAHQATLSMQFLAKMPEWVAILVFRGLSQPRDRTWFPALQVDSLLPEPEGQPKYDPSGERSAASTPFSGWMDCARSEGSTSVGSTACRRVAQSDFGAGVHVTM